MPRATTRSQKPAKGSRSQPQPTQTQRSQKRRVEEPDEDEEDEDDDDDDEGQNMDVDGEQDAIDDMKRMAYALARLALFNEQKRMPLRRDEISKKVLGSNTRAFSRVLEAAQHILRDTFGIELVELRTRAELDKDAEATAPGKDNALDEAHKATNVKKRATVAGSKTYILRSTLDERLIQAASATHEDILEDEAADAPSDDDDDDIGNNAYGSLISWSGTDQVGPLGVLYVILALILVSGRVMGDQDLRAFLKRLGLTAASLVPFSAQSTHPGRALTLDTYLTHLIRQGYLDRQQVGAEAKRGGAAKGKRGRVAAADEEAGTAYEWRWGARAQSEVGERGVGAFIAEFMISQEGRGDGAADGEAEEEEGSGAARARAKKRQADAKSRMEKMMAGIARAAGGQLSEVK